MHEASLAAGLLRLVAEQARAALAPDPQAVVTAQPVVTAITVRSGPLAGVEPVLLREAFLRLRAETIAAAAELVIIAEPLALRCRDCGAEWRRDEPVFVCFECGGGQVDVLGGDALVLESFVLGEPAAAVRNQP